MAQNMQYIWDEEFDNEAPLVDEVPPEVAAVAVPQQQLVAAVEQVPNAEVKNNRNGAQNWGVLENTSMMTLIDKGKKYNVGRTSPLWDEVAREFSNMRSSLQYFEHYSDMRQAMKSARANVVGFKYSPTADNSEFFAELLKLMTSGNKLYKAKRWWSAGIIELLFKLQLSDEQGKGENKPQDGGSLDLINNNFKNKFAAEENIRKRKLQIADEEKAKKENKKEEFMDSLASSLKELVQNVKSVPAPAPAAMEPSSAGRIREYMSGITPDSADTAERPVSRKEFDDLVSKPNFIYCYEPNLMLLIQLQYYLGK